MEQYLRKFRIGQLAVAQRLFFGSIARKSIVEDLSLWFFPLGVDVTTSYQLVVTNQNYSELNFSSKKNNKMIKYHIVSIENKISSYQATIGKIAMDY